MQTVLDVLKSAKQSIIKFENWSSFGSGSTVNNTKCAYSAIDIFMTPALFGQVCGATETLRTACLKLHNHEKVAALNDGHADETRNKTPEERFVMIHALYDKAIELASSGEITGVKYEN